MSEDITKKYGDSTIEFTAGDGSEISIEANKSLVTANDSSDAEDEINSQILLSMTKDLTVTVEIGTVRKMITSVNIPKPSKRDIKWANSLENVNTKKRQKIIRKMFENKDTWRVAYMCRVFHEKDSNLAWFDPNHGYYHEFGNSKNLLTLACHDSGADQVALLLQCDSINVNNDYGTGEYHRPLVASCFNKNSEDGLKIVGMLSKFKLYDIGRATRVAQNKTMREALEQIEKEQKESKPKPKPKPKQAALPAPELEEITTITENGAVWKKLDDESICKLTGDDDGFRLRKVFNFSSSTVTESHEHFDNDGKLISVTPPVLIKATSRRELQQAQTLLKRMNNKGAM